MAHSFVLFVGFSSNPMALLIVPPHVVRSARLAAVGVLDHFTSRKTLCPAETPSRTVIVYCPSTRTGTAASGVQTAGEIASVLFCTVYPDTVAGHFKVRYGGEMVMVSCGAGSEIANTVPQPELPP